MESRTIQTLTWRKIGGMESDASSVSTYVGDGKMGRSWPVPMVPRGKYAMGAPQTNMSHSMTTWNCDLGVQSSGLEVMHVVS